MEIYAVTAYIRHTTALQMFGTKYSQNFNPDKSFQI